jgi:hypothetical protein
MRTDTPIESLATATTDALEQRLLHLESVVAVVRAEQAGIVAELDARQVPLGDGCRSTVEWLSGRLNLAAETAGALTRLARSPNRAVCEALADGELSFDQAVEVDRLAGVIGDHPALEVAFTHDVAGLRRATACHRRLTKAGEQETFDARHLALQPNLDRTAYRVWGSLPGLDGSVVEKALFERADRFPSLPAGAGGSIGRRLADALASICQDSLGGAGTDGGGGLLATVFVDAGPAASTGGEVGARMASGVRIGPNALAEILCGGSVEVTVSERGRPLWASPAARVIPPALRRFVLHRDGGACTADGCTSRYRLQPHHIHPRRDGGKHDPSNLTTLCWFHHHVVIHGMGYRIDAESPPQRRRFARPDDDRGPP